MTTLIVQPEIGIPWAMSYLSGVPVTPSPQALEGMAVSEVASAERTSEAAPISSSVEASASTEGKTGVDLTLKGKSNWSPEQNAAGAQKAATLTEGETVVNLNGAPRQSGLRNKWIKAGNPVSKTQDIDHLIDLQLGGADNVSNAGPLDKSVNRSFGPQIYNQIKKLPDGTIINTVNFIPHSK
jgi:hypothetical protein